MSLGDIDAQEAFKYLYAEEQKHQTIKKIVNGWSLLRREYDDILQEVFEALYKSILKQNYDESRPLKNYMIGTAKNICLKRIHKLKKVSSYSNLEIAAKSPSTDVAMIAEERRQIYIQILDKLGHKCSKILVKAFLEGYSNQEIAEMMEYKNEGVLRKKKCNCLKRLNQLIDNNPDLKKLIKDED